MNAVMENILTRRSIRAFQNKEIPREELEQIIRAGLYAPSGQNRQTWKFTVVTDREQIGKLAEVIGRKLGRDGYDMYSPQVLIIPSNEKESRFGREDDASGKYVSGGSFLRDWFCLDQPDAGYLR